MFKSKPLSIPGLLLIQPTTLMDRRGWVSAVYNEAALGALGIHDRFVDDRISYFDKPGSVRGLRYQIAPGRQALLLRMLRGDLFVAAVDLRRDSPTFGRSDHVNITYMGGEQLYIMPGFAVGWCSRSAATEVLIKASADYNAELVRGLDWRDPALKIDWPVRAVDALLEPEDIDQPQLADQTELP